MEGGAGLGVEREEKKEAVVQIHWYKEKETIQIPIVTSSQMFKSALLK